MQIRYKIRAKRYFFVQNTTCNQYLQSCKVARIKKSKWKTEDKPHPFLCLTPTIANQSLNPAAWPLRENSFRNSLFFQLYFSILYRFLDVVVHDIKKKTYLTRWHWWHFSCRPYSFNHCCIYTTNEYYHEVDCLL